MMYRSMVRVVVVAGALGLMASSAEAQLGGIGTASGTDKLRVKGCGKGKAPAAFNFTVSDDGTWFARDEEGYFFSGGYSAVSAKKFDLRFDSGSEALFVANLENVASSLCGQGVNVTSAVRQKFFLKVNKKRTKAKVRAKYSLTGTAGGEPGTAKYILKAAGPYTEVQ